MDRMNCEAISGRGHRHPSNPEWWVPLRCTHPTRSNEPTPVSFTHKLALVGGTRVYRLEEVCYSSRVYRDLKDRL